MAYDNRFEELDAKLDKVVLDRADWLTKLQQIRIETDRAYDTGAIAEYQWRALVTRSAKIQDMINGD